jgi:hypothetical protein
LPRTAAHHKILWRNVYKLQHIGQRSSGFDIGPAAFIINASGSMRKTI